MRLDTTFALAVLAAGAQPGDTPGKCTPIKTVTIGRNAELRVNGRPFLPIMLWLQSEARIPDGLSIAVNTFAGNGGETRSRAFLDALARNGLYGVLDFDREAVGHSHLLGWIHGDEPDLPKSGSGSGKGARPVPRCTVEEVARAYREMREAGGGRPVFLTFTSGFMRESGTYTEEEKAGIYPGMSRYADVLGFDIYPIYGWNKPEWLYRVADGTAELRALAGPRTPVYAWIETNKGSRWITPANQLDVTPRDTRAEVWMALIEGATGIGYFTHRWVPDYRQFTPEGEMVAELRRLNTQIERLAPALLAGRAPQKVTMVLGEGLRCHLKATAYASALWIFAQNRDMGRRAGQATFRVPGLKAGTRVEVVDEGRSLVAADGGFSDEFAPLAEHIYRIRRR